jgi:hypothetical protein
MSSLKRRAEVGEVNAKIIQVSVETRAVVVGNAKEFHTEVGFADPPHCGKFYVK